MDYKKLTSAFVVVGIFCVLSITWIDRHKANADEFRSAQFLPTPQNLPAFKFTNQLGSQVSTEFFSDHWSLIFFGFTECADICPVELQHLSALLQRAEQHKLARVQVVFVSLDPERDTPAKMADYLAHFNTKIVGVRATHAELVQLSHFFAVDYRRLKENENAQQGPAENTQLLANSANNYQLEHSGRFFIINPKMQYIGSFSPPHRVEDIWFDLQMIIK